jgi:hypothetical protein
MYISARAANGQVAAEVAITWVKSRHLTQLLRRVSVLIDARNTAAHLARFYQRSRATSFRCS